MKTIYSNVFKIRDPETGEFKSAAVQQGESAYDVAKREGKFSGTEGEWTQKILETTSNATAACNAAALAEEYAAAAQEHASTAQDHASAAQKHAESASGHATTAQEHAATAKKQAESAIDNANKTEQLANQVTDDVNSLSDQVASKAPLIVPTVSGNPAVITDSIADSAISVVSHIGPFQEGSGDPSPNNVRDFVGTKSVVLLHSGLNLVPFPYAHDSGSTVNGVTVTWAQDGTIMLSGTAQDSIVIMLGKETFPSGQYRLGGGFSEKVALKVTYKKDDKEVSLTAVSKNGAAFALADQQTVSLYLVVAAGAETDGLTLRPQLAMGAYVQPWTSPATQRHTAELGETVYGGMLDWVTGVLTVTHRYVDNLTAYSVATSTTGVKYINSRLPELSTDTTKLLCNRHRTRNNVAPKNSGTWVRQSGTLLLVYDDNINDADPQATMKGLTVCYPVAPRTVYLTPQQIDLLKGHNALWSLAQIEKNGEVEQRGAGKTDVRYKADTKAHVEKVINDNAGVLGVLEPIDTIVLDKNDDGNERVKISLNVEPDGTPYRFAAVSLRAKFPSCSHSGNISISYKIGDKSKDLLSYFISPYSATNERNGFSKAWLQNGRWRFGWWTGARYAGDYAAYYENPVEQEQFGVEEGYITQIDITHPTGIPEQTTIEIMGVRVNA